MGGEVLTPCPSSQPRAPMARRPSVSMRTNAPSHWLRGGCARPSRGHSTDTIRAPAAVTDPLGKTPRQKPPPRPAPPPTFCPAPPPPPHHPPSPSPDTSPLHPRP